MSFFGDVSRPINFTFDDGPDPIWTSRMLAELTRLEVRATFFVIGVEALLRPGSIRATVESGHEVQLHCHRHVRHTRMDERELELDTEQALESLATVGVTPGLWRAPWGVLTAASERVARSFGLELVGWTIDTHDWRGDAAGSMLAAVEPDLPAGGSVLMHDGLGPGARREGCENTVSLLSGLVAAARRSGLTIEPLREKRQLVPSR